MKELVAIEYREADWSTPAACAGRVARVAQACADRGLTAVGVAGLWSGRFAPLSGVDRPAVLFGLRARTLEAVVAVGGMLGVRGFTGLYGWTTERAASDGEVDPAALVGHGMVPAFGADRSWVGESPGRLRAAFEEAGAEAGPERPHVWMPAPDRFDRAVDGLFLEEADRRDVDFVWVPGTGVNEVNGDRGEGVAVVEARRDEGRLEPDRLARWARGDRVERGRLRVGDLARRPGRWLREITGLR